MRCRFGAVRWCCGCDSHISGGTNTIGFTRSKPISHTMAFVQALSVGLRPATRGNAVCTGRARASVPVKRASRTVLRMGIGEDGLAEDLDFAQNCIAEGCSVDAVQDVLTRLEQRRAVLALEVANIEEVMATLARENLGGDRSLVEQAMEAAISIFSKADDNYPKATPASGYTMDKIKKQPKF